jgi:hypothetical protein
MTKIFRGREVELLQVGIGILDRILDGDKEHWVPKVELTDPPDPSMLTKKQQKAALVQARMDAVFELYADGKPHSLAEVVKVTGAPDNCSAGALVRGARPIAKAQGKEFILQSRAENSNGSSYQLVALEETNA